jgi:hypothetical protein
MIGKPENAAAVTDRIQTHSITFKRAVTRGLEQCAGARPWCPRQGQLLRVHREKISRKFFFHEGTSGTEHEVDNFFQSRPGPNGFSGHKLGGVSAWLGGENAR